MRADSRRGAAMRPSAQNPHPKLMRRRIGILPHYSAQTHRRSGGDFVNKGTTEQMNSLKAAMLATGLVVAGLAQATSINLGGSETILGKQILNGITCAENQPGLHS